MAGAGQGQGREASTAKNDATLGSAIPERRGSTERSGALEPAIFAALLASYRHPLDRVFLDIIHLGRFPRGSDTYTASIHLSRIIGPPMCEITGHFKRYSDDFAIAQTCRSITGDCRVLFPLCFGSLVDHRYPKLSGQLPAPMCLDGSE